jgi:cell division protein FtsL
MSVSYKVLNRLLYLILAIVLIEIVSGTIWIHYDLVSLKNETHNAAIEIDGQSKMVNDIIKK